MKGRVVFLVFSFLVALVSWNVDAFAAEAIPGEYLVKYKGSQFTSIMSLKSVPSVRLMDHNPFGQIIKVKVNPVDEARALAQILKDPNVEYVVPNIKIRVLSAPFDQQLAQEVQALKPQWANDKVNANKAWERAGNRGSRSVVVAVIDTGVDSAHPSLKDNMVPGYDFRDNDDDPMDKTSSRNPGHGTHCAGSLGASGLVDDGIVGLSPEVSIMPIRFLGEDGSGDLNGGIKSIDYAIQKGAHIISASWGATVARSQAAPLIEAVKRADDAGVIFIAAAANDGRNNDKTEVFPANAGYTNTITVAASGPNDEKPSWSNYGKRTVHLAAPGLDIISTLPGKKFGKLSGTSMATPLVSGLVALLKAQDPSLTGSQARALLQSTGAKVQIETACNCRVDAFSAVDTLLSKKMFISPAAASLAVGETLKFEGTKGRAPFEFQVANASLGSISADGVFTAKAEGETTVSVRDSDGQSATSLPILIGSKSSSQPPPDSGTPPGECPLGDPQICEAICQIQPTLPFCQK